MILVFLHGAPATGKCTVGRELASITGFELYHNHIVVDECLQRHAFGTPEFVAERDTRWRGHLTAAAAVPGRRLIFTFNPESTVPQSFVDWMFGELAAGGSVIHSVGLAASEDTIEQRLGSNERMRFGKLTSSSRYRRLRDEGTFKKPVIPRIDLAIDTQFTTPAESANHIVRHFNLV